MRLALAQLSIRASDVSGNVGRATDRIEEAAARGADLVVLPEIFNVGYFAFESYAREAEAVDGPTLTTIANAAADHDVGVLAGSIVEDLDASAGTVATPSESGYANTSVLFDRDGTRQLVYRKHHLFGYDSAEQDLLTPGEEVPVTDFDDHTVGVSTCYDLRFPELYRRLMEAGATLVLVPSAWPYPRVEHWTLLPQARAVENLLYVAAVNGTGDFEDAELLGRSSVYDPWGTILSRIGDEPGLVFADVDAERVRDVRAEFPALEDRR
ncbi:carbon-nitrogen family hydrolase [Haloarculaceae archaeon H-GB2-1]|nr:carbon-nitrogen family hydrolase [Haloarculaceae archaeon H-GB1-1]MEA5387348.1 carbon-nitrogen family hydrolase [Haloarculaceae archaeon H-GB11]MEA5408817.1 carbon-nitrogen family hydrolase [Haloarculaceae archaeon H-GB2-1]